MWYLVYTNKSAGHTRQDENGIIGEYDFDTKIGRTKVLPVFYITGNCKVISCDIKASGRKRTRMMGTKTGCYWCNLPVPDWADAFWHPNPHRKLLRNPVIEKPPADDAHARGGKPRPERDCCQADIDIL